ncbi:hypothetical protein D3C76_1858420 [compost metagenome]
MEKEIKKEKTKKDAYIRARVTESLKEKFTAKLEKEGLTEADFLVACVINFLDIKTVPEKLAENKE